MVHDNPLFLLGGAAMMIFGGIGLIGVLIARVIKQCSRICHKLT
jgi:hypothetical protein